MIELLICGAGNMGRAIASLLASSNDYHIHLADLDFSADSIQQLLAKQPDIKTVALDVSDESATIQYLANHSIQAIITCLPSELNPHLAMAAREMSVHYFDLGENDDISKAVQSIALGANTAFVPNCGLAPGIVGIITNAMVESFDTCDSAHVQVGTLLKTPIGALDHSPSCSINRIINQYTNPCTVIADSKLQKVNALAELEEVAWDDQTLEAFFASGCLGGLPELLNGKVQELNYKSIHFEGYCDKIRFLLQDLNLKHNIRMLSELLHQTVSNEQSDQVLIRIMARGMHNGKLMEQRYNKRLLSSTMNGIELSALQASTAAAVCAVVDHVMQQPDQFKGLIVQETFSASAVLANRFAAYYGGTLDIIKQ